MFWRQIQSNQDTYTRTAIYTAQTCTVHSAHSWWHHFYAPPFLFSKLINAWHIFCHFSVLVEEKQENHFICCFHFFIRLELDCSNENFVRRFCNRLVCFPFCCLILLNVDFGIFSYYYCYHHYYDYSFGFLNHKTGTHLIPNCALKSI